MVITQRGTKDFHKVSQRLFRMLMLLFSFECSAWLLHKGTQRIFTKFHKDSLEYFVANFFLRVLNGYYTKGHKGFHKVSQRLFRVFMLLISFECSAWLLHKGVQRISQRFTEVI